MDNTSTGNCMTLMKKKFVDEYHWIEENEMLDLVAIAQSSPGPIAVNGAIVVGYKLAGMIGVQFTSIFTAGDVFGDYTASGLMDGIGAYDNGDGTFTVLISHEINNTLGVVRDHGFIGTFV